MTFDDAQTGRAIAHITYGNLRQVISSPCGNLAVDGFSIGWPKEPCDLVTTSNCEDSRLVKLVVIRGSFFQCQLPLLQCMTFANNFKETDEPARAKTSTGLVEAELSGKELANTM